MDPDRLAALRRRYDRPPLLPDELGADPVAAFGRWLRAAAEAAEEGLLVEANAMVLATTSTAGAPSVRTVLLKAYDHRGFVFFTNYSSAKVRDLDANPSAALLFPWHPLDRQVRVEGRAERVSRGETERYFRSRPWSSQIGAWASRQSSVIADRATLDDRFAALAERWPEGTEVPVPDFWGGVRVVPDVVEFWQGRPDRLHDRLRFRRVEGATGWLVERLAP